MKKRYEFWEKLSLKCVLIGDTGVGKSSLAARVSNRTFKTDYTPTLFDNYAATVTVDDKPYHLSLFDTAGKEDYNKLRVLSYINSDVFLVCFSVTNPESLENAEVCWVPELRQYMPDTPFVLVGTQTDIRAKKGNTRDQVVRSSVISAKQASEVANRMGAVSYIECSAMTGEGVEDLTAEIILGAHRAWETKCTKKTKCCNCKIL
ncbi:cdc42 homolog [Ylistrum balloti]|uniref:cdc42 homolog n=1 Tax=Ylistrum balloti TaxID=509963 RepID=UPI002905D613|nr:cdc42 homolog [Ylistrum balloti]